MSHCYFISVPVWKYVKFWSKRHNVFKLNEIIRRIYTLICIIGRLSRIEQLTRTAYLNPLPNTIKLWESCTLIIFKFFGVFIITDFQLSVNWYLPYWNCFLKLFLFQHIYPHLANYIYSYEVLFIFLTIYKEF